MKPLEDAVAEVLAAVEPLETETVELGEALGRILAEGVTSGHDVPPFPNSAMDGYAVLGSDVTWGPVTLRVLEDLPAGSVAVNRVVAGTAVKIMTGAPIPDGADTVVKVELTSQTDADQVEIHEAVARGTAVRAAGGDFAAGTRVLERGTRVGPVEIALLATVGHDRPVVGIRPRVAVMSTGDELRPSSTETLGPGQIRDSNGPFMAAMVEDAGGEVVNFGIVGDDETVLTTALEKAAEAADLIVTSGGVSMGEYDLVKQVLAERGDVQFWQVAMQPAKPFAFGRIGSTPLLGLPGNPVSVMVAFEQFARPALLKMQGGATLHRPRVVAAAGERFDTDLEKTVFLRVALSIQDGVLTARSAGDQSSNVLSAVAAADGLAVIPAGTGGVGVGDSVVVELFRHPLPGFGR